MSLVDNELLFGAFTNLFVLGWLAVFAAALLNHGYRVRGVLLFLGGRLIPIVLLGVFAVGWGMTRGLPGDITSWEGVLLGNSVPEKVLFAWFEILGLALLVARWMVDDATTRGVPRVVLVAGLIGSFVAAAIGLLAYLLLSGVWRYLMGDPATSQTRQAL